jgi:hypothetical protein
MKAKYWISWYHNFEKHGEFELHSPWWVSGGDLDGNDTIVAAVEVDVVREDEGPEAARIVIHQCYDNPPFSLQWRFCEPRDADWAPFCDRFPKANWMQWS